MGNRGDAEHLEKYISNCPFEFVGHCKKNVVKKRIDDMGRQSVG